MHRRVALTATGIAVFLAALTAGVATAQHTVSAGDNNLRVVRTKHYELHTDLDPALVVDLGKRMDVMYDEYANRLTAFRPPRDAAPLPVYLFEHRADYMAVTLYRGANTGGMFVVGPTKTFLASFLEGQGRDALRRTLQHEAFHQFAYSSIGHDLPVWANEGLAQLFEEGIWTGRQFWLGQVPPRRVRQLQQDIKERTLVPFKKFLAVTPKQWADNLAADADRGATYYNQAWAMVYFLVDADNGRYRNAFMKFLMGMHNGSSPEEAWRVAIPGDIGSFQARFADWAISLRETPPAALIERQDTLGDLLVALHESGQNFTDVAGFRTAAITHHYRLHYTRGNVQWTTSDTPQLYFSGLDGKLFDARTLYFQPSDGPLPDIVCRAGADTWLRTHFYAGQKRIEHEVLVEPAGGR